MKEAASAYLALRLATRIRPGGRGESPVPQTLIRDLELTQPVVLGIAASADERVSPHVAIEIERELRRVEPGENQVRFLWKVLRRDPPTKTFKQLRMVLRGGENDWAASWRRSNSYVAGEELGEEERGPETEDARKRGSEGQEAKEPGAAGKEAGRSAGTQPGPSRRVRRSWRPGSGPSRPDQARTRRPPCHPKDRRVPDQEGQPAKARQETWRAGFRGLARRWMVRAPGWRLGGRYGELAGCLRGLLLGDGEGGSAVQALGRWLGANCTIFRRPGSGSKRRGRCVRRARRSRRIFPRSSPRRSRSQPGRHGSDGSGRWCRVRGTQPSRPALWPESCSSIGR